LRSMGICVHKSIQLILLKIELWNRHDLLLDPWFLRLSYVASYKRLILNHIKNRHYIEIREYSMAEYSLSSPLTLTANREIGSMALDRQVEQKDPMDEARLQGQLSPPTATIDTRLLIQDPTVAIPRIGEIPSASPTNGNGSKLRRARRLKDRRVCVECGHGFRPEGGSHVICNPCSLQAWARKRAEEYRTLVSMLNQP